MAAKPIASFGSYEVYEEIARGGMASVLLGRRRGAQGFSRLVAVKRLHPNYAGDPAFVAMLLDEARIASHIFHPNVVAPTDVVQVDGECLLIMDYVPGVSLASLIQRLEHLSVSIPIAIGVKIFVDILEGLHAAHEARSETGLPLAIVHRDISPQNLLVGWDGVAKVIDFGIAKAQERWQTTHQGQLKGKLAYMAKEQLTEGEVDRQTDVYSAAVVLFELLTGQRLFSATSDAAMFGMVLEGTAARLTRFRGDAPASLDVLIAGALSRDKSDRPSTAAAFAEQLEAMFPVVSRRQVCEFLASIAWESPPGLEFANGSQGTQAATQTQAELHAPRYRAATSRVQEEAQPVAQLALRGPTAQQAVSSGAAGAPAHSLRKIWLLAALAALLSSLTLAALWALLPTLPERPQGEASLAYAADPRDHVPPPPSTTPRPQALGANAPTEPLAKAAPSPVTESSEAQQDGRSSPSGASNSARTSAPRAATKPDCTKPYLIGADGIRRARKECLAAR